MPLRNEITLTFKEDVNGWTTFKSYVPDWGTSLNNRYYTFRLGSIWEHNVETNETFTPKELEDAIEIKFDKVDEITGDLVFDIQDTTGIVGLKLLAYDEARVTLWNETEGVRYVGTRIGFFPSPYEVMDSEFRLYGNVNGNTDDISRNPDDKFFILTLDVVNKNSIGRNIFYDNLTNRRLPYGSAVEFIINNDPSTVKQFKTIGYEGIGLWDFRIFTDVESSVIDEDDVPKVYDNSTLAGVVQKSDLKFREGKYFANINGTEKDVTNLDFSSVSVQGIGKGSPIGLDVNREIQMEATVERDVRPGYGLYYFENLATGDEPDNFSSVLKYAGPITTKDGTILRYGESPSGETPPENSFFLYARNNIIEKSGATGAYAHIRMSNDDSEHAEVFSVNSEVVRSSS